MTLNICRISLVLAFGASGLAGAIAATYPLDEISAGPTESTVSMRWQSIRPGGSSRLEGNLFAPLHLNTARWKGKQGRVYMTLPLQAPGPIKVRWTSEGALLPGEMHPGERALLYKGILPASLHDRLKLSFERDAGASGGALRLEFRFEIDVE